MFTRKEDTGGRPFTPLRGVLTLFFGFPGVVCVMLGATLLAVGDRIGMVERPADDEEE